MRFEKGEQFKIQTEEGEIETVLSIDGVSRFIMDGRFNEGFDTEKFITATKAIRQFFKDPSDGKPATEEQLKRFDEAVELVLIDKAMFLASMLEDSRPLPLGKK